MSSSSPSNGALLSAFSQHYAELVRYIARRTGNLEEARGLAHDTWLRIAEREPGNDVPLADPRAYLFTISHNLVMNHLRRGSWMQAHLAECEHAHAVSPALAPDVADTAMYRQAVAAVESALERLPPPGGAPPPPPPPDPPPPRPRAGRREAGGHRRPPRPLDRHRQARHRAGHAEHRSRAPHVAADH